MPSGCCNQSNILCFRRILGRFDINRIYRARYRRTSINGFHASIRLVKSYLYISGQVIPRIIFHSDINALIQQNLLIRVSFTCFINFYIMLLRIRINM